jgi:thiamine biosynthesis lipoprotein
MGTVAELKIVAASREEAEQALDRGTAELERIAAITTPHSDSSELSKLCRAGEHGMEVGEDLAHVLRRAFLVNRRSEGAFDPSVGAILGLWGFPETPSLPDSQAILAALETVGRERWAPAEPSEIPSRWTVREGTLLDLGGIAKGYAVERAAELLSEGGGGCLVKAGGDMAVRGRRADGRSWLIGIQHPRDPSKLFTKVRLEGKKAIATSGDYERFFLEDGVRYHHIFDPRSGWPARGVASVSVIAESCELADAWATAAFVLGPEDGVRFLEEEPEIEGLILVETEKGELVRRETSGFAAFEVESGT